jgi:hypothetical protein
MSGNFRVDCDSHVIEPRDLWLNSIERELRDWCVQFRDPLGTDLDFVAGGNPDGARRARFLGGAAAQLFTIPTGERLVRSGTTVT